jgi:ribosomal protein S18 acetylase RimI-like enzyme
MEPNARLLTLSDVERAAFVISDAFIDDPLVTYILPGRASRKKALLAFFRAYGQVSIQNRRGYGVGEPLHGVAYWKSPSQESISLPVSSLKIFLPLLFTSYPIGYLKAKAVFRQLDALHDRYAHEPHYYLDNIGVLESARGQGAASSLIRPILEQADAASASAYTDTVTEANVPLYEHFGFQCMEACPVEGTGITIWALHRQAKNLAMKKGSDHESLDQ